jgi:hypothetical protein
VSEFLNDKLKRDHEEIIQLTADRDAADRGLIAWEARAMRAEAELDALAAQVAALSSYILTVSDHEYPCPHAKLGHQPDCTCDWVELLANIPAAAVVFLKAKRVSEAMVWQCGSDTTYGRKVKDLLDEYRKAAGHG